MKLRTDLPDSHRKPLDDLLADEVAALVRRDRAWLSPRNVAAAMIRRISTVLAIVIASLGTAHALLIQSREDRLASGNYGELASAGALGVLFIGYVIASALDGISPKDAMFGPAGGGIHRSPDGMQGEDSSRKPGEREP
ncbi:hypothetical protein [Klenkia brasiliensis]|uniref:hypothetical protein n=1 Tax=Klenkia brasiliensis TaxID=333142 RepID=UPI0010423008|nr:hypothetical protein [Klenkia brasiliensis]